MSQVRAYKRRAGGRLVSVGSYRRRHLSPGRAWRNAKRAWRAGRRRRHTHALVFASVAAAEVGAWAAFRGAGVALTTIGVLAVGAGTVAMRVTGSRSHPWQ